MSATLLLIFIILVLFALILIIPVIRTKSAMKAVIKIFRKNNATDIYNAKTDVELGLNPKSFINRLFTIRDYKPYALKVLIEAGVVKTTEDKKLYLSEQALEYSKLKNILGNIR